jgi:hypothetical protein
MQHSSLCLQLVVLSGLGVALGAQTPQYQVVPAAYTNNDAVSFEWIAGASQPLRQQTLVGQSHLALLNSHSITAIELRRTAVDEIYQGGTMSLTVTLSTSPHTPLTCDNQWAGNVGPDALQVFAGQVTLPTSPAVTAGPQSPVAWTASNTLRIAFQQPFPYGGGTLCVDVIGTPVAGQTADWWMADAEFEDIKGTTVQIGTGCGAYGGPLGEWSHVAKRSLVPGARARFWAYGVPNGFAIAAFGAASPAPIPLTAFGIPAPGCNCHVQPGLILATMVVPYVPEVHPLLVNQATAEVLVPLPADPSWFGLQLTTQWFDLMQFATSNAITWTVASAMPTLDMALNEGHPAEATGNVTVHLAHVMRFEYQ